jgi:acyl-CoA synthetase (AMP-forming)/AMP-acid ligase II
MPLEPLPAQVRERTVRDLIERCARERRDHAALVAASHLEGGETSLSYGELNSRAARLAESLSELGVGRGDRVAILLDPEGALESHIAYHASHKLGAINVPLNTRYVTRELGYVLGFCKPAAVIFSPRFAEVLGELSEQLDDAVLIEAAARPRAGESLAGAVSGEELARPSELAEGDDADWIFTSGTTGNPKAVALTHANSVACAYQSQRLWGLDADSVYQSFSPFFTSTGCHTNLLACLAASCTYAIEPEFQVEQTLRRVDRYGTTSIFLISGVIQLIFDRIPLEDLTGKFDLASLQRVCYGGQPMAAPFYVRVEETLGQRMGLELVHLWGLTEGGTAGLLLPPELHSEGVRRAGQYALSIGTEGFNEWIKFRVASEDGDGDAEPGEIGELCLRGPSVMDRYVNDPEATEEALRGGWLHTGDMGTVDGDGYVYFVDRKKQMIRRGGLNISSAEVEGIITQHPAVQEAAVVPKPNPVLEQEVRAVVVLREGEVADTADIIEFCSARLADFKIPAEVEFIDALPRNAMGRVVKGALTGEDTGLQGT